MARINNNTKYPYDTNINTLDYLLGTDADDDNNTKSYRIHDIINFLNDGTNAYVGNVELNGTSLDFTNIGLAFGGSIDLSPIIPTIPTPDGNDFVTNVQLNGNDLEFTGTGGAFNGIVDLSSLIGGGTDGYVSTVILNGNNLEFTGVLSGFNGVVDLTPIIPIVPAPDGNDFVSDVQLNGNSLDFTGSGGSFNGSVDVSSLDITTPVTTETEITTNILTSNNSGLSYEFTIQKIGNVVFIAGNIINTSGITQNSGNSVALITNSDYHASVNFTLNCTESGLSDVFYLNVSDGVTFPNNSILLGTALQAGRNIIVNGFYFTN